MVNDLKGIDLKAMKAGKEILLLDGICAHLTRMGRIYMCGDRMKRHISQRKNVNQDIKGRKKKRCKQEPALF